MTQPEAKHDWYDVKDMGVEGKGWTETKSYYDRLPAKAEGVVRDVVWQLSRQPAGLCASFETDATQIRARWELESAGLNWPRMAEIAFSGLDLYAMDPAGRWRWAGASPNVGSRTPEAVLLETIEPKPHRYRVYLPIANPVLRVEIAVPKGATFTPIKPRTARPIVFYGTSICHGYCAARSGMPHAMILGRRLDRPIINLGFAGNALMEPEIGDLLAELDPAIFVIDPIPNMEAKLIQERAEPFVRKLREARPRTPIVLVAARPYTNSWIRQSGRIQDETRSAAFRAAYERLVASGLTGLCYVPGEHLFGDDGEASMDSSHPSDLGFMRMADSLEPVLRSLL